MSRSSDFLNTCLRVTEHVRFKVKYVFQEVSSNKFQVTFMRKSYLLGTVMTMVMWLPKSLLVRHEVMDKC